MENPISSMCPGSSTTGPPAGPLREKTRLPSRSVHMSARPSSRLLMTSIASLSYPEGPGALLSSSRNRSELSSKIVPS